MDLKRIEIFCKIVEVRSFTRAAEEIGLAQPTVSEHIRMLEEELHEKLLDRTGRSIEPTPVGKLFHQYARRMLLLRDETLQALTSFRGELAGRLLIGASTIPGAYLLPEQLQQFKSEHPGIELSLKIADTQQSLADLVEGKLELALVGAGNRNPQLSFTPLAEDHLVLAVNPSHPWATSEEITPDQLCSQPFILREEGSGSRSTMAEALSPLGIRISDLKVVAEMGNSEAVRQAVKAGIGAAIISYRAVKEELENGRLVQVKVKGLEMARSIYLVRHQRRSLSPLAEAFCQHLLDQQF